MNFPDSFPNRPLMNRTIFSSAESPRWRSAARSLVTLCAWLALAPSLFAASPYGKLPPNATPGDKMFAEYFRAETFALANRSLDRKSVV